MESDSEKQSAPKMIRGMIVDPGYQEKPGVSPIADGKVRCWNYSARRTKDHPVLLYLTVA
jgi:hypothetical protein